MPDNLLLTAGIGLAAALISFFLGRIAGGSLEKSRRLDETRALEKKVLISESGRQDLKRQLEEQQKLNEKYVYFVVRIPETVKNLNANLSYDEAISSIIRVTKDLVNADCIELYLLSEEKGVLELEAAFGSKKKQRVSVAVGEDLVGKAAQRGLVMTRERGTGHTDEQIQTAAPILFRGKLLGVIGIGTIPNPTGDERRLIAMVTDLAAVALQNCERLTTAQKEANTDPLTQLHNRKHFGARATEELRKAVSYNFPISIFMFDIDHFKKYNDQNGHAEGDYLLRELADLLRTNSRSRDVVARYGGEEFIVMLPNTSKEGAVIYGEKIRKLIENAPFRNREKQPLGFVSISGGIATFPEDGDTIEAVTKRADEALYRSKESGRNRVMLFEQAGLNG